MAILSLITNKFKSFIWFSNSLLTSFISNIIQLFMPYSVIDFMYSYNITSNFDIVKRYTDFDKVLEFNRLFNVPQISNTNSNEDNIKVIKNGFALITEEYEELTEAVEELEKDKQLKNHIEIKDALCDLVYVIYGLLYRLRMTSNGKLVDIANNFAYYKLTNDNLDIYKIIRLNTYINKNKYVKLFGNVNKYMSENIKLTVEEQFENITEYKLQLINNINALEHIKKSIDIVEKYINEYKNTSNTDLLEVALIDLLLRVYELGELNV